MRITNSMMVNQFLSESNDALVRVSKYQSQVDSTKRINNISDDPEATLLALKARSKLSSLDLYKANVTTANGYLKEAESSVSELNDIVKSAYNDIMSASSGSKTDADKKVIAEDLKNLQAEVLTISNNSLGTSYIFGGFNFTGTISGGTKTPPFTVDKNSGDLSYNGVNVSQLAWKDEYDKAYTKITDLKKTVTDIASVFSVSSTDEYNKTQAKSAADALGSIVVKTKEAMDDAAKVGINTSTNPEYAALKTFYDNISPLSTALTAEAGKDTVGDGVYTPDELKNKFSAQNVFDLFNTPNPPSRPNTVMMLLSGSPSAMDNAVTGLGTDLTTMTSTNSSLQTVEATKKATIQVGSSQNVDLTLTGLDLLGTGSNNVYHILGKAINALSNGGSPDQLSSLVTDIQKAQDQVLTLQTNIGATQNRLNLTTNRYTSNEMNYTEMKSNAEDADVTEAYMNLTMAMQVYNASLSGGSNIIKTSLIDFLR